MYSMWGAQRRGKESRPKREEKKAERVHNFKTNSLRHDSAFFLHEGTQSRKAAFHRFKGVHASQQDARFLLVSLYLFL